MREIKVRGKALMSVEELNDMQLDHDNGWVVGNLIQSGNKPWIVGDIVESDPEYIVHDFWVRVDPKTVGQYTGLRDKHGKEIYADDVVEAWSEGIKAVGKVQQRIDGLWIIYPAWQKEITWGLMPNNDGSTSVEIIGNIHDHPHLLRGDE